MVSQSIRWVQRFDNYTKVLQQLENAVKLSRERELSELEQQGLIQSFEYTHELAWKTLKDFLEGKGNKEIYGSKDVTREAFKYGILSEGEIWMDMIASRNKTSHTYNQSTAQEIVRAILTKYFSEFTTLQDKLVDLKQKS